MFSRCVKDSVAGSYDRAILIHKQADPINRDKECKIRREIAEGEDQDSKIKGETASELIS